MIQDRQAFYDKLVADGMSPLFAEMLATQKPPGMTGTDQAFHANRGTLADQFAGDPIGLSIVTKAAKRAGYRPMPSDVYVPGLATFAGDPAAFIKHDNARGQVKKVCEKNGWAANGAKPPPREPKPAVRLAESLVQEKMRDIMKSDPGRVLREGKQQLREAIIERHGSKD